MIKRALMALFACLAVAAVAAGCGGGGSSTSSGGESSSDSGSAPTKAAFIKEADAVCKVADDELNVELEAFATENGITQKKQPTKAQQIQGYEDVVLPNIKQQSEELGELTPPEGDEDAVGEIVDGLDEGVEEAEADPEQLVEGKNPLAGASSKARAYGLKVCGSESN
jgi:hypothetical protein